MERPSFLSVVFIALSSRPILSTGGLLLVSWLVSFLSILLLRCTVGPSVLVIPRLLSISRNDYNLMYLANRELFNCLSSSSTAMPTLPLDNTGSSGRLWKFRTYIVLPLSRHLIFHYFCLTFCAQQIPQILLPRKQSRSYLQRFAWLLPLMLYTISTPYISVKRDLKNGRQSVPRGSSEEVIIWPSLPFSYVKLSFFHWHLRM